jgi:ATP-dependent 26S proteasome regulatory subunit
LETAEEERAEVLLEHVARRMGLPLFDWTPHKGLIRRGEAGPVYGTQKLHAALSHIASTEFEALYHFHQIADELTDQIVIAQLVAAERVFRDRRGAIFVTGVDLVVPRVLDALFARVKMRGPTAEEYYEYVRTLLADVRTRVKVDMQMDSHVVSELLTHLNGLTLSEVRRILTAAMVADGSLGPHTVNRVMEAKKRIVQQSGVLEYYATRVELADIAGLANLKQWLSTRAAAFKDSARASEFGLTAPRGVLLLGVQGCGKSLSAKAVSAAWNLPLLRLDPARLYDKYVGETERNLRTAIDTAERLAPVVLWIDEIEKALAVTENDGGASQRLLGTFLTWLQEKRESVFVVATANDVTRLPPELLRKGRFDEIFFVDLPDFEARCRILATHLKRRKRDPELFDLSALSSLAAGFSGAEIEEAIIAALYVAFERGVELDSSQLAQSLVATVPLSVTMKEAVARLRTWAEGRTVRAD